MRAVDLRNRGKYLVLDILMVSGFLIVTTLLLRIIHGEFGVEFAYSSLVGILGGVIGLVIAVVITPFTSEERTQWSNLTSAIIGAVAGYGISILDDSISYVFKNANLLQNPILGIRTALFLSYGAFAMLYGFSYRRYYVTLDLDIDGKGKQRNSTKSLNPAKTNDKKVEASQN